MAWKARIAGKTIDRASGGLVLVVDFFDDTQPRRVLHTQTLTFPAGAGRTGIRSTIQAAGHEARDQYAQREALAAQVNLGQEIPIDNG